MTKPCTLVRFIDRGMGPFLIGMMLLCLVLLGYMVYIMATNKEVPNSNSPMTVLMLSTIL